MHRTIKPHPHHLCYAARIIAVRLVDLRLQHRPHMSRLNADHRQARFGQNAVKAVVRDDDVCRRLMTIPGVGPVVALTYRVTVDVPARFRNSKAVGAVVGLTPAKYQSGENDRTGAISRCGDEMMRVMLYEAAQTMLLVSSRWSWLKACLGDADRQAPRDEEGDRRPGPSAGGDHAPHVG